MFLALLSMYKLSHGMYEFTNPSFILIYAFLFNLLTALFCAGPGAPAVFNCVSLYCNQECSTIM